MKKKIRFFNQKKKNAQLIHASAAEPKKINNAVLEHEKFHTSTLLNLLYMSV